MSIRINVGATFDARDVKAARRELDALEDQAKGLNSTVGRVGRGMQNFGSNLAAVGSIMTKTITAPILGAATAATQMAASFSESMSRITGLVGIASDEVKEMESAVLGLSGQTAKSPQELAEALFVVTSAGLRGAEAIDALEFAAKAAAAGLGATNDIARAVSGAMNAYGRETLNAAAATDIIVATARAGNFATDQFAGALGRVLPFAQQAEASLQDVGGAVALLTRTNGNAAESITQIQALFRAFVVPSEQAKKILDEVGLSAADLRQEMGERGLVSTLRTLDSALGGNRERLGRLLSSTEAASAAFQILNADSQTVADTFGVVSNAAGITDDAFNVVSEQSAFKFRAALNDLTVVGIELGARLLPVVTDLVDRFRQLVDRFNNLSSAQQDNLLKWAGIIALVGPAIAIFGTLIAIIGGVVIALGALSAAMIVATGGLVLLFAAIGMVAFRRMTRDTSDAARALDHEARAAQHAANGHHALAEAERLRARNLRTNAELNEREIDRFTRLAEEQRGTTTEFEAGSEAADAMADALAALGVTTDETSDSIAASGPKVVALSGDMRALFQGLNDTNAGAGGARDAIAQFAREVLVMGNITEGTVRGAERLAQVIRQDIDKSLADANRKLDEAVAKFDAYRDAIARGIVSGNTMSDAAREQTTAVEALTRAEQAYADAVASNDADRIEEAGRALREAQEQQKTFLDFLRVGVTTAEGFAAQIDAIRQAGASLEVVQQIAELGAETGGRIAAELLAGGAEAIEQANRMVTAVENASKRAGIAAAEQFFGAGVNAARAMVRGIEATIPELQGVLDRIADAIERALGVRPNVDITGKTGPFIPPSAGVPTPGTGGPTPTPTNLVAPIMGTVGQIVDPGTIRMFATGGLVLGPTLGMVGEAGPELIVPLDRLDMMGGKTYNINVSGAIDPEGTARTILRTLRDAERRTGESLIA